MNKTTFIIQTFTMTADLTQDRIRLDAVDVTGDYQAIWYTRRLTERFLPHLSAHVEKSVQTGLPRDILLSMNQEQLRIDRAENPLPSIQPSAEVHPWLCQTVHLNPHPEGLQWTMTDDLTVDAHMVLTDEAVRAVLDVFLNTFRALEWSEQAFPEWVREAASTGAPAPGTLN